MNKVRTPLSELLARVEPFDDLERRDLATVREWLASGRDLYRTAPADPPEHLVSYCVVVDHPRSSMLLMDHIRAGLWAPTGGHVEVNEEPYDAAIRELAEELGSRAAMVASVATLPLFVSITEIGGPAPHRDISLWYVVAGDERMWLEPDRREFRGHRWARLDDVLEEDEDQLAAELPRFIRKLQSRL